MPDVNPNAIKNMSSANLQRYAKLILTKAYAKAAELDSAASSAITDRIVSAIPESNAANYTTAIPTAEAVMNAIIAQHYVTIAKHVGNINTVQNPSSTVLYFQKDDNNDPSWNIYIYAAVAGSDPVTYEWINVGDSELDLSGYFEKADVITSTDDTVYTDVQLDAKVASAKKVAADITAAVNAKAEAIAPAGAGKLVGTTATAGTTTTYTIAHGDLDIAGSASLSADDQAKIPDVSAVKRAVDTKLNASRVLETSSGTTPDTTNLNMIYTIGNVNSLLGTKVNTSAVKDTAFAFDYEPSSSSYNGSDISGVSTTDVMSLYRTRYALNELNAKMLYKETYLEHLVKIFGLAKKAVKDADQLPTSASGLVVGDKILVTEDTSTGHNRGAYVYTVTSVDGGTATYDAGVVYAPLSGDVNSKYNFANITTTTSEGAATANTAVYSAAKSDELLAAKFDIANVATTTNNLASSDTTVYSAAKADALLGDKVNTSDVIDATTGINATAANRSDDKVVSEAALGAKFDSIDGSISTINGTLTSLGTNKVNYTDIESFTDTEIGDIVDAAAAELES